MPKRKLGALEKVEADLPNLQHKIKKDPLSYQADFENQHRQYGSYLQLFLQNPGSAPANSIVSLRELVDFVAHVSDCYPKLTADFPGQVANLLTNHHDVLEPDLRDKLVGALMLLRKKEVVDSTFALNTLFPILVATPSKSLRALLYQKIISDVRSSNAKSTNHKLNRTLQTVLYNLLVSDRASSRAIWCVRITKELWRRQIWTDTKAVEIMKEAALADSVKVAVAGVNFFLGGDKEREDAADSSDDGEDIDIGRMKHQAGTNKKTKKRERELKTAAATLKKKERKKSKPHPLNFSAFHLLHDPQGFAETLFARHLQSSKSKLNLEQKLLVLQLVSRLVGLHKLTIISLYSYFLKYLTPRQASVTSFLASLAQSTHNLVPPDVLEPLVQKIANEFVSEASAGQVAAAGLNAIREICARQPMAMNDTLLQDLVLYRKSKDKGVMMAAKGLLSLYREVGADLLKKRDRGKNAAMGLKTGEIQERRFGEEALGEIEGLELLEKWKAEERQKLLIGKGIDPASAEAAEIKDDEEDWKAWDVQEDDDSDGSGGWIDVESDGEDIAVSDSDDDDRPKKKLKDSEVEAEKTAQDPKPPVTASLLATTRILTPADLAKLNELRLEAAVNKQLPGNRKKQNPEIQRHIDDPLTAEDLERAAAIGLKKTKEEKIAGAKGDKLENHQSATANVKRRRKKLGKAARTRRKLGRRTSS